MAHWAATAETWVARHRPPAGAWPLGRPLLVTENDRASGLFNGDTGVVIADGLGGVVVAFGEPVPRASSARTACPPSTRSTR